METIWSEDDISRKRVGVGEALSSINERLTDIESNIGKPKEKEREFKFPFRWQNKFKASKRKSHEEESLVMFFNKKNEIEAPQFMRIIGGNVIIHKSKSFLFDPRDIWRLKIKGYPQIYCLKEIDKRPITNRDWMRLKKLGYSTDTDEILLKQLLEAKTQAVKANRNMIIAVVVGLIIIGGLVWFFSSSGSA